jgi:hypothetical protein
MMIRQHIPTWLKRFARIFIYGVLDGWDVLRGKRKPMTPPRMTALIVGSGDFQRIGEEFLGHFIRECGLKPEHKVLEIGAGYGRMAVGLTPYITGGGGAMTASRSSERLSHGAETKSARAIRISDSIMPTSTIHTPIQTAAAMPRITACPLAMKHSTSCS